MIDITNQNKEDLIASCLIEAANVMSAMDNTNDEILEEAVARDLRKASIAESKATKKSFDYKMFISGKMDKQEAQEVYKKISADLDMMKRKVDEIPPETTGEKIWGYFRHQFTLAGLTQQFIGGAIISAAGRTMFAAIKSFADIATLAKVALIYGPIGSAAQIAKAAAIYNKLRKTSTGEKNWNKAYAESMVAKLRKKLDTAYNKYYASSVSNNEKVKEAMGESVESHLGFADALLSVIDD